MDHIFSYFSLISAIQTSRAQRSCNRSGAEKSPSGGHAWICDARPLGPVLTVCVCVCRHPGGPCESVWRWYEAARDCGSCSETPDYLPDRTNPRSEMKIHQSVCRGKPRHTRALLIRVAAVLQEHHYRPIDQHRRRSHALPIRGCLYGHSTAVWLNLCFAV